MLRFFYIVSIFLYVNLFSLEDVIVLGGGISGISSAIYLARAGYSPIVVEGRSPGGVLTQSNLIQNWPAEKEISGADLMEKMRDQAISCGVKFVSEEVTEVAFETTPFKIKTQSLLDPNMKKTYLVKACIIAMGTTPNQLQIPGEKTYWGKGVSNCAVCDGFLYKGKKVAVIGGGDGAILEAEYLSDLADTVYVFVRKKSFKTVESRRAKRLLGKKNVKVVFESTVQEILGSKDEIKSIRVSSNKQTQIIPIDGVFLAVGSSPNTSLFQKLLKLDPKGYIVLDKDQQTSILGVFAAGDIADPIYKQAISASADGAKAALEVTKFLKTNK